MTDVKRTLKVPLKVKEGGHSRRMSTQEGALMLLREKALRKVMRGRSIASPIFNSRTTCRPEFGW